MNSLIPERTLFVTKLPFRYSKFFSNHDYALSENLPFLIQAWMSNVCDSSPPK